MGGKSPVIESAPGVNEARPAKSALSKTSGYLTGFTHTLQPYLGCRFGCGYCYVASLPVHRFHRPKTTWGDYVHPRIGIAERLAVEMDRIRRLGRLHELAIFMSSATDPYQPAERSWRLSRACLDVLVQNQPAHLTVQTRSPLVADDFSRLILLGKSAWLSMTLETDLDCVRRAFAPKSASVERRLQVIQQARSCGLQVQIAVSPCLPFSSIEQFGGLLCSTTDRIVIDTFASGDGSAGRRTSHTNVPGLFAEHGFGDWREETEAMQLYTWLKARVGDRVGWSREGFVALPTLRLASLQSSF